MLLDNEFVRVSIEHTATIAILHTDEVKQMNKATLRFMREYLDNLCGLLRPHYHRGLWTAVDPERKDLRRLALLMGFKYVGTEAGYEVYNRP